jgi:hypothetical protein
MIPQTEVVARDRGMAEAAEAKRETLELAREMAENYAREKGTVSADNVQLMLQLVGIPASYLGNAAGSIFKDRKVWECVGTKASTRAGRHGSLIRVWRLR